MATMASKDCQREAHFTFIWTIENASALLVPNHILDSPKFIMNSLEKSEWILWLHTNLTLESFDIIIGRQKDNVPYSIQMEFELSILDANGSLLRKETSMREVEKDELHLLLEDLNEVLNERRAEILPNDTFTVRCRMWRIGIETLKFDMCFARTSVGMERRSFIWAIREFSSLQQEERRTYSLKSLSYGLELNLFLREVEGENYVNFQIFQKYATWKRRILCKIFLLSRHGRVVYSKTRIINGADLKETASIQVFKKDKLMINKYSLLPNDVLTLRCEFQIQTQPIWSRIEHYRYLNLEDLELQTTEMCEMHQAVVNECHSAGCIFKKILEDIYEDENVSDVNLRAGGASFPAHKNVLSVRSPVFRAMFTQDMRGKASKVVDISDLNADTLGRLLLYIYKNVVQELRWESAIDLFRAADKYQLLDLRKKCSLFLKSNLCVTSVSSTLLVADIHKDSELKKAAETYISRNYGEIFKSVEWKNFKWENFRLALEVMEKVIQTINRKKT